MSTSSASDSDLLVSPTWVRSRLFSQNTERPIVILDGSWHMPASGRDPLAEFHRKHIPRAEFFGIDEVKDKATDLPHMLPSVDDFCKAAANMNITPESHIVVYDTVGMFSACRVYWTFRVFNHPGPISVLNGGLPNWIESGFDVESTQQKPKHADLNHQREKLYQELRRVYSLNKNLVWTYDQVVENIKHRRENLEYAQILDARPAGRFNGTDVEPRPGLSSGHIPFSISVPFQSLIQTTTGNANVGVTLLERKYHPAGSKVENGPEGQSLAQPQRVSLLEKSRPVETVTTRTFNEADASDVLPETPTWSVRSLLPPSQSDKVSTATQVDAESLLRLANLRTPSPEHVQGLSRDVSSLCHFVEHIKAVDVAHVEPLERLGENWAYPLSAISGSVNREAGNEKPVEEESGRALLEKANRVEGIFYVVDNATGDSGAGTRLLGKQELREVFESKGVMLDKPIVTSCGSGITASILFFALELAGAKGQLAVYDGSWSEYASLKGSEILNAK